MYLKRQILRTDPTFVKKKIECKGDSKMKKMFILGIILIVIVLLGKDIILGKQPKGSISKRNTMNENQIQEEPTEIFEEHYKKANRKLQTLTLEEKIAQLLIVDISASSNVDMLQKYSFGGYVLFKSFFENKTEQQVKTEIANFQKTAKIPLLIAVDEEGGSVVRVSANPKLVKELFLSSRELYKKGGFEEIRQDTIRKSKVLENLGINLNFAPVVDIVTSPNDYMYKRAFGEGKELTSEYAKTVIRESKKTKVSYTLKHFPGYGENKDTHTGNSVDTRTYEQIYENDLEPFRAGIEEGAEVVMVSHNVVTSIDEKLPASISPAIHKLLREELNFSGIMITDDMKMGAIKEEYSIEEAVEKAILAGNDMMILSINDTTTNKETNKPITYQDIIEYVKSMVEKKIIKEETINTAVKRILAWKHYKGLL